MATRVIVLVSDRDDPKHGEVTILNDARKAERLVETLLEAGFEQERIRIFTGAEMDMRVRQRPVVALVTGDEATEAAPHAEDDDGKHPAAPATKAESRKEEVEAAPYERNGVRFSTTFRPA